MAHIDLSKVRSGRAQLNQNGRRGTLDEELRNARVDVDGDNEDEDFESGVLMGVGTRSKKSGYLAHGGAGGIPVFMGVGYVEGAEDT